MLHTTTACCRCLASDPKLLILRQLSLSLELKSGQIARGIQAPQGRTSSHLARLRALCLVRQRPSGSRVHYRLMPASVALPGAAAAALVRRACRDTAWATAGWRQETILHLSANAVAMLPASAARALDVVFDAATAFAHARRLLILRLLLEEGPRGATELAMALKMSLAACARHLDKLCRRGFVRECAPSTWDLSLHWESRVHEALWERVAAWNGWPARLT